MGIMRPIQHSAELKVNKLFGDIGLLEPYGRLDNPNYVTPYEKTIEIIKQALVDQRTQLIQAVEHDDYIYEPIKSRVIKLIEGKE